MECPQSACLFNFRIHEAKQCSQTLWTPFLLLTPNDSLMPSCIWPRNRGGDGECATGPTQSMRGVSHFSSLIQVCMLSKSFAVVHPIDFFSFFSTPFLLRVLLFFIEVTVTCSSSGIHTASAKAQGFIDKHPLFPRRAHATHCQSTRCPSAEKERASGAEWTPPGNVTEGTRQKRQPKAMTMTRPRSPDVRHGTTRTAAKAPSLSHLPQRKRVRMTATTLSW